MNDLLITLKPYFPAIGTLIILMILRRFIIGVGFFLLRKIVAYTPFKFDTYMVNAAEGPAGLVSWIFVLLSAVALVPEFGTDFCHLIFLNIFTSGILLASFWFLYNLTRKQLGVINRTLTQFKMGNDEVLERFIRAALRVLIVTFALIFIARAWGYDIPGLITGLGVGGIAIALAAQETLSSIVGGIMLIIDKPFGVGDRIKTAAGEGVVHSMGFRTTKVQTFTQGIINIPNSALSKDSVTNWSKIPKRRVEFRIGLTYDTTVPQMQECLSQIRALLAAEETLPPEDSIVIFETYSASSLDIWITYTTTTMDYNQFCLLKERINMEVMNIVTGLGLSFAFPSRSIYLAGNTAVLPEKSS